ncbi:hypothetical protein IW150_003831 [Coemansia sp. RSA 2607]|nr:hypothetical protein IW150_003831 [Coemansia sp. RSA 2607]
MSSDSLIIIKATLGAVSVCIFFLATALFFYYFRIRFTPLPHIYRWHGRRHPLWIPTFQRPEGKPPRKMTLDEIERTLPRSVDGGTLGKCLVCLDLISDGQDVREMTCGHCFHCSCIDPWLTTNASCPTCRNEVFIDKNS